MLLAFTLLAALLSSYFNNMAIFCLLKNCIFDNSNFTIAHIAQLVEHFHGKEEVACSTHAVGTIKLILEKESFNKKSNN